MWKEVRSGKRKWNKKEEGRGEMEERSTEGTE
jgi:hypothetical protein